MAGSGPAKRRQHEVGAAVAQLRLIRGRPVSRRDRAETPWSAPPSASRIRSSPPWPTPGDTPSKSVGARARPSSWGAGDALSARGDEPLPASAASAAPGAVGSTRCVVPFHQRHAELGLERRHGAADRSLGDVELARGVGGRPVADDGGEQTVRARRSATTIGCEHTPDRCFCFGPSAGTLNRMDTRNLGTPGPAVSAIGLGLYGHVLRLLRPGRRSRVDRHHPRRARRGGHPPRHGRLLRDGRQRRADRRGAADHPRRGRGDQRQVRRPARAAQGLPGHDARPPTSRLPSPTPCAASGPTTSTSTAPPGWTPRSRSRRPPARSRSWSRPATSATRALRGGRRDPPPRRCGCTPSPTSRSSTACCRAASRTTSSQPAASCGVAITAYGVLTRGLISGHWDTNCRAQAGLDFRALMSPRFQRENLQQNLPLAEALRDAAEPAGHPPPRPPSPGSRPGRGHCPPRRRPPPRAPRRGPRRAGAHRSTTRRSTGSTRRSRPASPRATATPRRRWASSTPSASGRRGRARAAGRAWP